MTYAFIAYTTIGRSGNNVKHFVPASLIFDDGSLQIYVMSMIIQINLQPNYDEPLHSMLNPCSTKKEKKDACSVVDELLHKKIGGFSYAVGLGP